MERCDTMFSDAEDDSAHATGSKSFVPAADADGLTINRKYAQRYNEFAKNELQRAKDRGLLTHQRTIVI